MFLLESGDKMKLLTGIVVILFLACLILILSGGCFMAQRSDSKPIDLSAGQSQLWDAVRNSNWLVTLSIVGIAASIFAYLNGSKLGLAGVAACCVSLFMALAVARFATWMAVCGLIGSVVASVVSILVKNTALKEIIKGVQGYRAVKIEHDDIDTHLESAQEHKSTKKIVKKVKDKLV